MEKIEDQYSDVVEKESYNLKITFVFTHKKIQPLKLMQMLKLLEEVKKYAQLLHKKELKQYSKIIPQIIFISLFLCVIILYGLPIPNLMLPIKFVCFSSLSDVVSLF